jgi:tetratricopeptide (TPR) repeat protein
VSCPPEEAFAELLSDTPSHEAVARLESHADACPRCRDLIAGLAPGLPSLSWRRLTRAALHETRPAGARMGRYVIERTLGFGGMGVVYAAVDPDLDRRVAVKLLRPDLPGTAEDQRRLLVREAQAMARLQHANVITVHEVGTVDDCTFIAMEYVDGQTLRAWLAAERRDWRDIVRMFVAAGEGLHAAHAVGLVHRDFKPDNVLVEAGNGRIRVTDFGLARLVADEPASTPSGVIAPGPALTRSGGVAGTPRYMAPEQLRGRRVDARTDLFSFSVALYEALFGQPPFTGATPHELLQAMEADVMRPPPPGTRVPARLLRLLRQGLGRDPAARPRDLEQLLAGLRRVLRRRAPVLAAALAGGLLVGGVVLSIALRRPAPIGAGPRQALAVLPLTAPAGDNDLGWLGPALAEVVGAGLHAAGGPRLVPTEDVTRTLRELDLPTAAELPAEARRRVRSDLRADYVVSGAALPAGDGSLRVVLRLTDLATGRTLATADERGDAAALATLAMRASARLRPGLGERALGPGDGEAARAALPTRPEALRAYGRGLLARQLGDHVQASRWFGEAAALEPSHAYSHLMLAQAYKLTGEPKHAELEAARAFALCKGLERDEQLAIEAMYRELNHEYDRAVEIYRALLSFFPDRVDWTLRLATVQGRARRGADCLATLTALRRLPPPDPEDPNIDVAEAWCHESSGDFQLMRTAAARGRERAERRGGRLLAARATLLEARAMIKLGEPDEAMRRLVAAQATFHELDEAGMETRAIVSQGDIYNERHEYARSRERYEKALSMLRAHGDTEGELITLNNLATGATAAQARPLYERVLVLARRIDDPVGVMLALNNVAMLDGNNGDVTRADRGFAEELRLARQTGAHQYEALALTNLCSTRLRAGDTAGALAACAEAAAGLAKSGNRMDTVLLDIGLAPALDDRGQHGAAEVAARRAASTAHALGSASLEAIALGELAIVQVNAHHLREAGETIATARARSPQPTDAQAEETVAGAAARLQAATARTTAARRTAAHAAAAAAAQAHAGGFICDERDARLLQYQLMYDAGQGAEAKPALVVLEAESRRAGDLYVARRAAALLQR